MNDFDYSGSKTIPICLETCSLVLHSWMFAEEQGEAGATSKREMETISPTYHTQQSQCIRQSHIEAGLNRLREQHRTTLTLRIWFLIHIVMSTYYCLTEPARKQKLGCCLFPSWRTMNSDVPHSSYNSWFCLWLYRYAITQQQMLLQSELWSLTYCCLSARHPFQFKREQDKESPNKQDWYTK